MSHTRSLNNSSDQFVHIVHGKVQELRNYILSYRYRVGGRNVINRNKKNLINLNPTFKHLSVNSYHTTAHISDDTFCYQQARTNYLLC